MNPPKAEAFDLRTYGFWQKMKPEKVKANSDSIRAIGAHPLTPTLSRKRERE